MENEELRHKLRDIKSRIEHLQGVFSMSYKENSRESFNKLIIIKRNLDKLKTAARYLSNIEFVESNKLASETSDPGNVYKDIVKNISRLEKEASAQLRGVLNKSESRESVIVRKNLDNLKLAYNALRNIEFEEEDNKKKAVNKIKKLENTATVRKILGEDYEQESKFQE